MHGLEEGGGGFAEGFVVLFLVGEVGGLGEGGEGLEVEVGVDGGGAGGVDGLDGADGGLVVFALGEFGELWEGEAVDLADEDGGHRGIEEVFEEALCKLGGGLWCVCL
ncbi:MAG: hypothetical protein AB8C13_11220 [Phycisphaerales bacterium]